MSRQSSRCPLSPSTCAGYLELEGHSVCILLFTKHEFACRQLRLTNVDQRQMSLHVEKFTLRSARYRDSGPDLDCETDASQGDDTLSGASALGSGLSHEQGSAIIVQEVDTKMKQLSLLSTDGRPSDEKKIFGMDMVVLGARLSGAGRCPQPCLCRCHSTRPSAVRYPSWIGTIIGSLSVTYDQRLLFGGNSECTELGCKGRKRSSATFEYQLPAWLCARFVSFQVYIDSFRVLRSSLRIARVLPLNDITILSIIMHDTEVVKGSMRVYGHLFPDDRDTEGYDIMLVGTYTRLSTSIRYLIQLTKDSFSRQ